MLSVAVLSSYSTFPNTAMASLNSAAERSSIDAFRLGVRSASCSSMARQAPTTGIVPD